jgi:hypothetical protein
MSNQNKKSDINNLIGAKVNQKINNKLSAEILCILCDSRYKVGIFIQKTVSDITKQLFENYNKQDLDLKQILKNEKESDNLIIRTELYKLKQKNLVKFINIKKDRYTVIATEKGFNHFMCLCFRFYKFKTK